LSRKITVRLNISSEKRKSKVSIIDQTQIAP
jgi:hypothetical protein